jgi:hypothetical protein
LALVPVQTLELVLAPILVLVLDLWPFFATVQTQYCRTVVRDTDPKVGGHASVGGDRLAQYDCRVLGVSCSWGWPGVGGVWVRDILSRFVCSASRAQFECLHRAWLRWSVVGVSWRRVFLRVRGQVSAPRTENREDEVFVVLAICAVRAEGLIPGFPSQAFVRHCSCPQHVSGSSSRAPPRGPADLRVAPRNRSAEESVARSFCSSGVPK